LGQRPTDLRDHVGKRSRTRCGKKPWRPLL
jgi:hypothetical protein